MYSIHINVIQLENVTKTYQLGGESVLALDKIELTIQEGEFVAIVGPSGSGKSTLANIIGGMDICDSGDVIIHKTNLSKANDTILSEYRNKTIGFVFQNFNLQANYTALENVAVPLVLAKVPIKVRNQKAQECLEVVGLGDRLRHKPAEMSGGQRQRVAIARALANNPKIIIADEPTGNLDSKKSNEIIDLLKQLNKQGLTLIIITHDPDIASEAGRIISIHDGKLKEK